MKNTMDPENYAPMKLEDFRRAVDVIKENDNKWANNNIFDEPLLIVRKPSGEIVKFDDEPFRLEKGDTPIGGFYFNTIWFNQKGPATISKGDKYVDNTALNYDTGKLRLDLIPPEVTVALALAFGYGAEKYSDDNWLKGMNWSRHIGSLERHLLDWKMGQTYDKESGNHHLSHALVRMAMLLVYELRELGNDDRKFCYKDSDHLTEVLRKPSGPYQYELPL